MPDKAATMKIAYVSSDVRGQTDKVLSDLAGHLQAHGKALAGIVKEQTYSSRFENGCDMKIRVLPDGPVIPITQNLGAGSDACRLDPGAITDAVSCVENAVIDGVDLFILNKFGPEEMAGRGFCHMIGAALDHNVPVLVGVSTANKAEFEIFAGGLASSLPAEMETLLDWCHAPMQTTESPVTNTNNPDHPCGNCTFYAKSVWNPVEPGSVSVLARGFSRKELDEGQVLFQQNAENRAIFCVSKGLIALCTHHANGKSTLLRLAYPGDVIGFRSFLGNNLHQTEARALLPSRVCAVAGRNANKVVHGNATVLANLTSLCLAEIDKNHERIIATATMSNKQRLADLLEQLMKRHGTRSGDRFRLHLPLSRSDLADLLGVQPETLSRLIKRLEKDGAFVISGREVEMFVETPGPKRVARFPTVSV